MRPAKHDFPVYAGEPSVLRATFTDGTTPLGLTGTWKAQARRYPGAADPVEITVDTSQMAVGILTLTVPATAFPARDALYVWDLQGSTWGTVLAGNMPVTGDVTRDELAAGGSTTDLVATLGPDEVVVTATAAVGPPGPSLLFNVLDFGAVADNVTDDGPAFKKAVTAAKAVGGGTILVPPSALPYFIGTRVDASDGTGALYSIRFLGAAGHGSKIRVSTGLAYAFRFVTGVGAVTFEHLAFYGTPSASHDALTVLSMVGVARVRVDTCAFDGMLASSSGLGVIHVDAGQFELLNTSFNGCGGHNASRTSVVRVSKAQTFIVRNVRFFDGGLVAAAPRNAPYAWILVDATDMPLTDAWKQGAIDVLGLSMDEGTYAGLRIESPTVPYEWANLAGITVNAPSQGDLPCIHVDGVNHLTVSRSMAGYHDASPATRDGLLLRNIKTARVREFLARGGGGRITVEATVDFLEMVDSEWVTLNNAAADSAVYNGPAPYEGAIGRVGATAGQVPVLQADGTLVLEDPAGGSESGQALRTTQLIGRLAVSRWTSRTEAVANQWFSIAWSPALGLFCAVALSGTGNRVMTSPNGVTWTTRTSAADNQWRSICWSPDLALFCAVSITGTGNRVMTSPDGITWTPRTTSDNQWGAVAWSPALGLFCAVALSGVGNRVMTSPDGITWTLRTSAADHQWSAVSWSPELSLFCATSMDGTVMTSPDGVTWTLRTAAAALSWFGLTWSPDLGLFCAVANTGTTSQAMTSPDGITWTLRATPVTNQWRSVAWASGLGRFVAVSSSSLDNRVMTSPDGVTWTAHTSAATNTWFGVTWSPELGLFCAVAHAGTGRVMTSDHLTGRA